MPFIFEYIVKLSVSLGAVYLFYQLVLRKLTFYNWNRWFLLIYTLISFFVPFIDIAAILEGRNVNTKSFIYLVPSISNITASSTKIADQTGNTEGLLNGWNLFMVIILAGAIFLLGKLVIQILSYRKMLQKGTLIMKDGIKIYQLDMPLIPFSFGNSIFINQQLHTARELKEIIYHEFVHVKQKHTIDILWGELLCIVNWFNPFAWLIRGAIRQNLEFIADNKVLEGGIDKKQYQYLLLKVVGNNQFSIASQFNFSSLKKRIAMMNKMQSAKRHLIRFLFILPVAAVMLLAFRQQPRTAETFPVTLSQMPDTPPVEKRLLPEGIKTIEITEDEAMIQYKDGATEKYDLKSKAGREAFNKKYGELIPSPPPVPPVPSVPPAPVVPPVPPVPSTTSTAAIPPVPSVPPVPPVPPAKATLPANVRSIEINNHKAEVKFKNGKTEIYDLNDKNEKKEFEKRYVEIEEPLPPPPPVKPLSTISISGSIKGDVVETTSNTVKKYPGPITFIAEAVNWNGKERTLHLKGDAVINDAGNKVKISGDVVDIKQPGSFPVMINGKEAEWDKNYINENRSEYIIYMLGKEEAVKKYGEKGKDGVLEINSIQL